MRKSLPLYVVLLAVSCGPVTTPSAPPLEPEDFVLAGMPSDADSAEIRLSFGDPDSVVIADNPYDAFAPIESWYYPAFIVRYEGSALPSSFLLTGGDEATLRGVRVGDPADRVLRRYGPPTYRHEGVLSYADPLDADGAHVLEFLLQADTVALIHLGRNH